MAVVAYTALSSGFVLQKKGIGWLGWKGKKERKFYKYFIIWFLGFVIMNIYGIPSAIALKTLSPHLVSAFAGWGIVVLIFLSRLIIGEKSNRMDYLYSFLIIAGIIIFCLFENISVIVHEKNIMAFLVLSFVPVFIFIFFIVRGFSNKWKNVLFASASGIFTGMMVVVLNIFVSGF